MAGKSSKHQGVEPVFAAKDQASVCLRDYVEWLTEALKRASSDSPPGVDYGHRRPRLAFAKGSPSM
jgi:hypothetical protein